MKTIRTAKEARSKFIEHAVPIMENYILVARGENPTIKSAHGTQSEEKQKRIFDALMPMLQAAGDAQKIEVGTTASIIEMLKQGTLTFLEAKQLMDMLSIKSDMDDVKKLLEAVNQMNGNSIGNG